MRTTLTLPRLSPGLSSLVLHFMVVFLVAFGGQLTANAAHVVSIKAALAVLSSAAIAGVVAVVHVALGFVPTPAIIGAPGNQSALPAFGIPVKVKTAGYQLLTSVAVMFVGTLGASLTIGAAHVGSFPDLVAVAVAAISAAIFAVVQFLFGLLPAPKNASNQSGGAWGGDGASARR